jgi:CDP-glucose 4,6-dehydratase
MESLVTTHDLAGTYKGKKVFITGHTGFKGTWLNAILQKLGAIVCGYALPPEDSKQFHELFISSVNSKSIIADIRDKERLKNELLSFQPDFIFHLAAQPLVLRSYEIPAETFEVNVVGTANLLEALRSLDKKCTVVVITTDKVYDNKEQHILYNENDVLGGYDPYSASKACTEMVVNSFRNSFYHPGQFSSHQKAIATARAGNVIGGGDWSENRIVPDTIRHLMKQEAVKVRNPDAVRPWQHVLEPLVGYLVLGSRLDKEPSSYSEAFNFGPYPEDHLAVKELVQLAIQVWGKGEMEFNSGVKPKHEAGLLQLNIEKALKQLKWQPRLHAADAIHWTVEWYKKPLSAQASFTFEQIDQYLAL